MDGSRLKIAYEATALLGARTGVGEFCDGALKGLAKLTSLEVGAFAISYRRRKLLETELPKGIVFRDWILPARPLHWMWERTDFPPMELWDRRLDVVHGTNFVVPPTRSAGKVVTVHDLTTVRYPQLCERDTLKFPAMVQRAINAGAFVHTPSEFVASEVVEHFRVDPSKVVAVHHGIPSMDAELGLPLGAMAPLEGRRYVLGLGTVEPRKDFPLLVKAFDLVASEQPDLILVIAGRDGWGAEALAAAIAKARFRSKIFRLGYVTSSARRWLLANATLFAYPSVYEGFGFPPLEAMSLGTPVVSTSAGALSEVLSSQAALLVESGDVEGLASAMAKLSGDSFLSEKLRAAGVEHARSFSWDRCAEGLASLYRLASRK